MFGERRPPGVGDVLSCSEDVARSGIRQIRGNWKNATLDSWPRREPQRGDLRLAYRPAMRVNHLEFRRARARARRLSLYTRTNSRIESFRELGIRQRAGVVWHLLRRFC